MFNLKGIAERSNNDLGFVNLISGRIDKLISLSSETNGRRGEDGVTVKRETIHAESHYDFTNWD